MGLANINQDEFDSVFELVIAVLFMSFGVFAIAMMQVALGPRLEVNSRVDKVQVSYETHTAEDPFYFTPYQAYMFAWNMDGLSDEPLMYRKSDADMTMDYNPTEYDDNDYQDVIKQGGVEVKDFVILSTHSISTGTMRNSWYSWRNRRITGGGKDATGQYKVRASVQSIINECYGGTRPGDYWNGTTGDRYHLEYTYNNVVSSTAVDGTTGRFAIWQLKHIN